MKNVVLNYEKVIKETDKAILVKLVGKEFKSLIWLPKYRIKINKDQKSIKMTKKLADEKVEEAKKDYQQLDKEKTSEHQKIIKLRNNPFDWEKGKMFGIRVEIWNKKIDKKVRNGLVFFPKSLYKSDGVPEWALKQKIKEFLKSNNLGAGFFYRYYSDDVFVIKKLLRDQDYLIRFSDMVSWG